MENGKAFQIQVTRMGNGFLVSGSEDLFEKDSSEMVFETSDGCVKCLEQVMERAKKLIYS